MKRISRLNPAQSVGRESAERHYTTVHYPFARRLLREHGTKVRRYATNRADRQYSIAGRFDEEPTAWRFVLLDVDDDLDGAVGYLPRWAQPLIWQDHAKCIEGMAAWEVEPGVIVDTRSGQLSSAKFLFLYDGGSSEEELADRRNRYLDAHVPSMKKLVGDTDGLRLYVSNLVVRAAETSGEHGPSASYTGGYLDRPSLVAIDEFWFDNAACGDELFSSDQALGLLRDSPLGRAEGYLVSETIGLDRTGPPA
jgi:hypothetical protein